MEKLSKSTFPLTHFRIGTRVTVICRLRCVRQRTLQIVFVDTRTGSGSPTNDRMYCPHAYAA